ncbi:MAG TPA: alpha-amylase family glycosyl hydrolase [Candidatus Saccharimonadales bacterium]|nr:alpha-amylase family glycosyl hydrolase [Candidatus Saccharimonadales bacterium]
MSTNNQDISQPQLVAHRWAEGAIVYQIYPRSFKDSNGDGIGDLPGIIDGLDHVQQLGVNAIWLSPFYPSPMADFGYDISDYCNVDPVFGTLDDFKRLLAEAAKRNIRIMVDLVPNHTSDEHAWFLESKQSRDNPKADWYVWKDPNPESEPGRPLPPNNWRDQLAGDVAWEWNEARGQFYLHSFDVRQPDLNWSNPDVRDAIKHVMRFWLDLGVDGFRVDAVYWMAKDPLFRDDDRNPHYLEGSDKRANALIRNNSSGWPPVYAYLNEMARVLKEKKYQDKSRFMVTEAYPRRHNLIASYMAFYEGIDPEVAAPFNFEGLELGWRASSWTRFLRAFHLALEQHSPLCVSSYAFGNHDKKRLVSRIGLPAARSAAVMEFTLPGMVFVYNGEEIGMRNVDIPPELVHDPEARHNPRQGRDPVRTPLQWSPGKHAGFTDGPTTWLPIAADYKKYNIKTEHNDPQSFLSLYQQLAKLRNGSEALRYGRIQVLEVGHEDVVGYVRSYKNEHWVVLINFSDKPVICVPGVKLTKFVISSEPKTKLASNPEGKVQLLAHECALFLQ